MDKEPQEIPDDSESPFVSLAELLLVRKLSPATLARAIKKCGVYTHVAFDERVIAGAEGKKQALDALEMQHEWESESPMHKRAVQSPIDQWGDDSRAPYARCGWPTELVPDFDAIQHRSDKDYAVGETGQPSGTGLAGHGAAPRGHRGQSDAGQDQQAR